MEIFKLIDQVPDFTKGIVSIVTGPGRSIGAAMGTSKKIDMISFTGDTSTGKTIMEMATNNIKKLALELGGKSPNVVFPDANLDKALPLMDHPSLSQLDRFVWRVPDCWYMSR